MGVGLFSVLYGVNLWAGTLAPTIEPQERIVLDDTFYEQNTQLNVITEQIRGEQGASVIALGDSTLYGALTYQNETIPYYLRGLLQPEGQGNVFVHNLAFPGARPADLYGMLKRVEKADPELIVVDVNVVFFSERLLAESALANQMNKRAYIFERDVPRVFKESRVEEAFKSLIKETNIGQYEPEIRQTLFGKAPRDYVREAAKNLQPEPPAAGSAPKGAPEDVTIGKSWLQKSWGEPERLRMERIYGQGPLTEENDSVKALRKIVRYGKEKGLNILFYMTPQNKELIGKFFSVQQLTQNEEYLLGVLQEEGAWVIDLRDSVPRNQFADYDHMLKGGHERVATLLRDEIRKQGVLGK
jgi:hypothetical protein